MNNIKGGFGNMVWVRDKDGREYACTAEVLKGYINPKDELSEEEKSGCMDVSTFIGTERW